MSDCALPYQEINGNDGEYHFLIQEAYEASLPEDFKEKMVSVIPIYFLKVSIFGKSGRIIIVKISRKFALFLYSQNQALSGTMETFFTQVFQMSRKALNKQKMFKAFCLRMKFYTSNDVSFKS